MRAILYVTLHLALVVWFAVAMAIVAGWLWEVVR